MSEVTFNFGGYAYSYDSSLLRGALRDKGLDAAAIDAALTETGRGDFSTLESLGLTAYLRRTELSLADPGPFSVGSLSLALEHVNAFNFVEVMTVLHEAAKELRQANREMRHAERDAAMSESLLAAGKIRSAALVNMIFGVVSGATNIVMGVASAASAGKQAVAMKGPGAELKAANIEMKQVKADARLAESQVRLQHARTEAAAKTDAVAKTDAQVKATRNVETARQRLDAARAASPPGQAEIQAAATDLEAKQARLTELGGPKTEADVEAAKLAETEAGAKVAEAETEVKGLAAKAEKANARQIESLEKEITAKEAEIAGLEKAAAGSPSPEAEAKLQAARNERADLQQRLDARRAQVEMYRNPASDAALAGAAGRLGEYNALSGQSGPVGQRLAAAQEAMSEISTRAQVEAARVQSANSAAGGLNQALTGMGNLVAADEQAEGSELTAEAQKQQAMENESADYQKAFNDMLQSVQNILKEVLQAQNQANASIFRNM